MIDWMLIDLIWSYFAGASSSCGGDDGVTSNFAGCVGGVKVGRPPQNCS